MTKTITVLVLLYVLPISCAQWQPAIQRDQSLVSGSCDLNKDWQGSWFQIERTQPLQIGPKFMDRKGECIQMQKSKNSFIFRLQTKSVDCWKCIIFFPQHKNVLMYKETRCSRDTNPSIEKLCSQFDGDTPRITLFRVDAKPEPCPIAGPLEFTYRDNRGECASHMSTVDQCASASTLRFMYQSCPEHRSESKTEDMECIGDWSSGWNKMFAARILNRPAITDGQKYRCIIYDDKLGKLGISAEASCRELMDIDSASVKLDYIKGEEQQPTCSFFRWLQYDHANKNRAKIWESMSNDYEHRVIDQYWIVHDPSTASNVSVASCISAENFGVVDKFVVYRIDGCKRAYYCIKVFKRLHQVIEVLEGAPATTKESACTEEYFTEDYLQFDTLLLKNSVEEKCPHHGRYTIQGCDESGASVSFGCTSSHQLRMDTRCTEESVETYNCHGHWIERDVNYLVLREKHTGKKSCFVYTKQGDMLSMSGFYRHPCKHGILPGVNGHRVYNVTSADKCLPTSAAHNSKSSTWVCLSPLRITIWMLGSLLLYAL